MSRGRTGYSDTVLEFDAGFVAKCTEAAQEEFGMGEPKDNSAQRKRLLMLLYHAIRKELTPIQQRYFIAYYEESRTMKEIGEQYGVAECTVSRTLQRARRRLQRAMAFLTRRDFR